MSQALMKNPQQSATPGSALWTVPTGTAMRLSIGPGDRDLHVTQGRLWLTCEGRADAPAEDVWLHAGETLALATGSEWVIEGWGDTRFQLLVPPRACAEQARRFSARPASSSLRWSSFWRPVQALG